MIRKLLITALVALALTAGAAGIVSADESTTVYEYTLDEDTDDLTLDDETTVRLILDENVSDLTLYNDSDTENATVLLSQTETGEYEDAENVSWTDDGDEVEFVVTGNLSDHLDDGYYETNDENVSGDISISSGVSLPPMDEDLLPVPLSYAAGGLLALVALVAGVVVGRGA